MMSASSSFFFFFFFFVCVRETDLCCSSLRSLFSFCLAIHEDIPGSTISRYIFYEVANCLVFDLKAGTPYVGG